MRVGVGTGGGAVVGAVVGVVMQIVGGGWLGQSSITKPEKLVKRSA